MFAGLWITGVELNITAMMGMVMIIGIATEMAMFLVSEFQVARENHAAAPGDLRGGAQPVAPDHDEHAGDDPGAVPLGVAISGSGDQMLQPLAIAIIAGITVQLPLVLLVLPVLIGLLGHGSKRGLCGFAEGDWTSHVRPGAAE